MGSEKVPGGRQQTLARVGVALLAFWVVAAAIAWLRIGDAGLAIGLLVIGLLVVGPLLIRRRGPWKPTIWPLAGVAITSLLAWIASATGHSTLGPFRFSGVSSFSTFLAATTIFAVIRVASVLSRRG